MMDEFDRKEQFVRFRLAPLVMEAARSRVAAVQYEHTADTETVVIRYECGYIQRVCVTADSLLGLCRDVLKVVN